MRDDLQLWSVNCAVAKIAGELLDVISISNSEAQKDRIKDVKVSVCLVWKESFPRALSLSTQE